jgi:hypothetical protein
MRGHERKDLTDQANGRWTHQPKATPAATSHLKHAEIIEDAQCLTGRRSSAATSKLVTQGERFTGRIHGPIGFDAAGSGQRIFIRNGSYDEIISFRNKQGSRYTAKTARK